MSKAVAPRDTKLDSGTQLTESNLSSIPGLFRERSPQTVPFQTRQAANMLGSEIWGRRFPITRLSRRAIGSISTLEKTVDQPISSPETEDSPRSVSAGESPQKKRG